MKYLSIKNFTKHQHYKDRRPPWIKLHAEVLDDYHFGCLQDASKAHLMLLWVLASKHDNKIPYDLAWITKQLQASSPVDVEELVLQGFIEVGQDASEPLAKRKQSAMPETETERESEKETYTGEFRALWLGYPKRSGTDSRADAERQFLARRREGESLKSIQDGLARYAAFVRATKKEGTEKVMQGARFFGRGKHYLEEFALPDAPKPVENHAAKIWQGLKRTKCLFSVNAEAWQRNMKDMVEHGEAESVEWLRNLLQRVNRTELQNAKNDHFAIEHIAQALPPNLKIA